MLSGPIYVVVFSSREDWKRISFITFFFSQCIQIYQKNLSHQHAEKGEGPMLNIQNHKLPPCFNLAQI